MSERSNPLPPWKETPLDHWSTDIDPAVMAGDEWASEDPNSDPGAERISEHNGLTYLGAHFMHPVHDTNFGLLDDVFVDHESE